jgi:hypothetical protein
MKLRILKAGREMCVITTGAVQHTFTLPFVSSIEVNSMPAIFPMTATTDE